VRKLAIDCFILPSPATIRGVLTATIAAVILVALYAVNQRYFAMKWPHCGRVVSIHGKHKFVCDKCAARITNDH